MKSFATSVTTAGAFASFVFGLAGAANAASSGPSTVGQTVGQLLANERGGILSNRVITATVGGIFTAAHLLP